MTLLHNRPTSGLDVSFSASPERRNLLGALIGSSALAALPVSARVGVPAPRRSASDQRLCQLGEHLEAAYRAWVVSVQPYHEDWEDELARWKADIRKGRDLDGEGFRARTAHLVPLQNIQEARREEVDAILRAIRETPAESFAGLAVKGRALEIDIHGLSMAVEADGERSAYDDRKNADHDVGQLMTFVDEVRRLAAVEVRS